MRWSTLLLLLVLGACAGPDDAGPVVIEDFLGRSPRLACEPLDLPDPVAVTELRTASDSTVLVLDEPGRRVLELDAALRLVWVLEAPAVGPGALSSPVSAALLGDTAVAVAERQGLAVIVYSRSGSLIRTTPLGFAPSAVAARPSGELLVTAMPFGGTPGTLAVRYDGMTFHELPVPPRPYDDMFVGALGNTTLAEVLADGTVLVVHQFMAPRAFRVDVGGGVEPLRVPTPDATRSRIDYVPTQPLGEAKLERMLVPASAMSVDRGRGEVYLLTRSGRRLDRGQERAILRLDDGLRLLESATLDVMARHLAVIPRDDVVLVVDDDDLFYVCDFRRTDRHARAP
jgi:hypothetical protein